MHKIFLYSFIVILFFYPLGFAYLQADLWHSGIYIHLWGHQYFVALLCMIGVAFVCFTGFRSLIIWLRWPVRILVFCIIIVALYVELFFIIFVEPAERDWLVLPNDSEVVGLNYAVDGNAIFDIYFKTGWLDIYYDSGIQIWYPDGQSQGKSLKFKLAEDGGTAFLVTLDGCATHKIWYTPSVSMEELKGCM